MKLITLNTWGGQVFAPLKDFVSKHAADTDIFCFQEVFKNSSEVAEKDGVRMNLLQDIQGLLPNHEYYFGTKSTGYDYNGNVDFPLEFGVVTFVKKAIEVIKHGDFFEPNDTHFSTDRAAAGKAQYVTLMIDGKQVTICNLHGLWNGGGKTDAPERIEQSKQIRAFFDTVDGERILAGDFNLLPDTESIKMLEEGMKNLITEYGVTCTRSHHYTKEAKFADYILVSPGIEVQSFEVLQDVVSDHLPLMLEFN